ncbi:amidohydrolase [Planobispora rosea]|uniref:Amidohydrolase n=1 Tax=Planobispora rosea TaxID=35762 RepID=A0A8J3WGC9_PLARO|nr:amidohydrolase family protein [Planobispora rosea]GGS96189.1 amidohydrolase [Planobispora rosea]GIH87602.1 amidohydrolase [Planobispora rosea]
MFDGSLAEALRYRVTTELDMFCLPQILQGQRRLAAEDDDVADLRSAGTLATAPGGHPTHLLAAPAGTVLDGLDPTALDSVSDPAQAPAFVQARLAEGADYLKIVIDDGTVHGADLPVMTPETAAALTASAHDAGLRVIAHAITASEVGIALDAGVDGLAHVWTDLAPGDPAAQRLAERVRAREVFVVTTLAYFEAITARHAETPDCARPGSSANAVGALRALRRAGVPLLAGTDATPFVPAHGAGMHRELRLLTEAGLSAEEALAAATSLPARHFGLSDRGRVVPGLRADLVLVEGDPTRDIAAVGSITDVWRRGARQR